MAFTKRMFLPSVDDAARQAASTADAKAEALRAALVAAGVLTDPTPAPPPAPTLTTIQSASLAADGLTLTLTLNQAATIVGTLALLVNGVARGVTWTTPATASSTRTGTLASAVQAGQAVTFSAAPGFTSPALAAAITGQAVTNNSTVAAPAPGPATPIQIASFAGANGAQPAGTSAITFRIGTANGSALNGNGRYTVQPGSGFGFFEAAPVQGDGDYSITLAAPGGLSLAFRANNGANWYYTYSDAATGEANINTVENAAFGHNVIRETAGSGPSGTVWTASLRGNRISYFIDGVRCLSVQDSSLTADGAFGFQIIGNAALSITKVEYLSVAAADAAYAAAHPAPTTTAATLNFNGPAGAPTGIEALTVGSGDISQILLNGSGALSLGRNDGVYANLSGVSSFGNGTITINYPAGATTKTAGLHFGQYSLQRSSGSQMEMFGPSGNVFTLNLDPSASFGISHNNGTLLILIDGKVSKTLNVAPETVWGAVGVGTAAYSDGTLINSIVIDPVPLPAPVLAPMTVMPRQVSTSVPAGYLVLNAQIATSGTTSVCQAPGVLQSYAITDGDAASFFMRGDGKLTTAKALTLGDKHFNLVTTDSASGLTRTDAVTIPVPQGNLIAAGSTGSIKLTIPQNINNNTMSPVIGTPTCSGVTGSKVWTSVAEAGYFRQIECDALTGALAFSRQAAARVVGHTFDLYCSDGINTAKETFNVPVAFFVGPKVYLGVGNASTDPGYDFYFSHFNQLIPHAGAAYNLPEPAYAGAVVTLDDGGDDNYFADDFGDTYRDMFHGPLHFKNKAGPNGRRVCLGGRTDSYNGGYNSNQDKAATLQNGGDFVWEGIRWSHCFGDLKPDATYGGRTALRVNGGTYGDTTLINCQFDNNSNGFECGDGPNRVTIKNCVFFNNGGSTQGSGQTHAAYIGAVSELVYQNNLSYNNNVGHCLKSRAYNGSIEDSTLADGAGGSASAQLNIPQSGNYTVRNNMFHKGPTQQNPNCIGYGEDDYGRDRTDLLNLIGNTFFICAVDGSHNGAGRGITHFGRKSTLDGAYSKVVATGNNWFFSNPSTQNKIEAYNIAGDPNFGDGWTETGSVTLDAPPALNLADPGTANPPAENPGRYNYLFYYGDDNYANMNGVQITPSVKDIRVLANAAPGTVLATLTPYGADLFKVYNIPNDIRVNPFVAGSTWAISTAPEYFAGAVWPPAGRYEVMPSADGTIAQLRVGAAGLVGNRVDTPKVRVTAPNGTIVDWRFPVSVLA